MKKLIILVFTLFLAFSSQIKAQGVSTDGKDFYLGFLYPSYNRVIPAFSAGYFRIYALISSYQDNTVYVSYFNDDGTEQAAQPYKVQARKAIQVQLSPALLRMTDPGDQIKEYKSLHITSKRPISVQFFSTGGSSCGMYTSIPTTLLGKKYVIASYNDNPEGQLAMLGGRGPSEIDIACGFFQVIGTQNGTTVTITPTSTTQGGRHTGVTNGPGSNGTPRPYSISLNRGQCYMVKSHCGTSENDITGSIVESDKPVAVISGHENLGIGSVGNRSLEGRDYMVEQMIPVVHWANTGYVSLPFVDSEPNNGEGIGENYRVIVYDSSQVNVHISPGLANLNGTIKYYPSEVMNVTVPVDFSSDSTPFMIYQIDQANHSAKEPFPRPSMAQIIPISRWKNAYLWFVPSNVNEKLQGYYVNIIAPKAKFDSIYISKNGQKEVLIGAAGLSLQGTYQNIPNHPELIGKRYKVFPGSFYARANFPFTIYNYGNRAADADGDLGDFDNDDLFFSYASPLGYQYTSPDSGNISIKVDTLCNSWRVCVTDKTIGGDISSATLLDDPYADIIIPPLGHAPYQYVNTRFTANDDPNNTRDIIFAGTDSSVCFIVNVEDPGKDGYAPLLIADAKGHTRILELTFKKSAITITPDPVVGGNLGLHQIGTNIDSVFTFVNLPTSERNYTITDVSLIVADSSIKIVSVTPPLPALIKPGDTLKYTVRFSARDTNVSIDTVRLVTNCSTTLIPITGEGGCGIIVASDHDFGNVVVVSTACTDTLSIRNIGKLPFTLSRDFLLQDTVNFSFNPDRVRVGNRDEPLPLILQPDQTVRAYVCFHPKNKGVDSTALIWKTDIPSPYTLSLKTFSVLRGRGIQPGVQWDRPIDSLHADSTRTTVHRRYLINSSTAPITINDLYLAGPDAAEFSIVGMQNPLEFAIDTGSWVWIDFGFKPDMSRPANYLRRAYAIATNTYDANDRDTLLLLAGFHVLKVQQELQLEELSIYPNPTLGEDVTASFGLTEPKELGFMVYDMLGREVLSVPASYFAKGKQSVTLSVSKLNEGGYILRVSDKMLTKSIGFRVVK